MDIYFGTFKASFNLADKDGPKAREDAKSSLRVYPTREFLLYLGLSVACVSSCAIPSVLSYTLTSTQAFQLSTVAGFGPVVLASLLSKPGEHPVKMSPLANLMHLLVGSIFCSLPVTYMCYFAIKN
jgi:hypothetical protein